MYGVGRLAEATVDLYEDGSRYVESGLDRIGRKFNRGVTVLGLAASLLAGVACTGNAQGYKNSPTPLPSCATIPDIPYTLERTTETFPDVRIIVAPNVENKKTSCSYDGIEIDGDYVFVRWTSKTLDFLKKTPEYYAFVKNNVIAIQQTDIPSYGQMGNTSWGKIILASNKGVFGIKPYDDQLNMVRYNGRIVHESEQIRKAVEDHSAINNIKNLVILGDTKEIGYLETWLAVSGVSDLIDARQKEILDCQNTTKDNPLVPACNQ